MQGKPNHETTSTHNNSKRPDMHLLIDLFAILLEWEMNEQAEAEKKMVAVKKNEQ